MATAGTELRFFDASGRKIRSFGRKGGGPGEFQWITFLGAVAGDTVIAFDGTSRRLTVVGPAGNLIRTVPLANPARQRVAGLLRDGAMVAGTGSSAAVNDPQSGITRDTTRYVVIGPRGDSLSTVGRFAGHEAMIQVARANGQIASINITTVPFGRNGYISVDDSGVVVAPADRYEVMRYTRTGRLLTVMRRAFPTEAPPTADLDRLIESQIRALPPGQEGAADNVRRSFRSVPLPKSKPPYDGMMVRSNGEIWLRDYQAPGAGPTTSHWTVFDRTGVWLTTADVPPGVEPLSIGVDTLLGTWLDPDGVPHVRLYRITGAPR